ncbi:MAG: aminotransferase [Acidimicrobiia bacterium]|nr:MAG: aminotransferase [Acidimicrobiia bacterium]
MTSIPISKVEVDEEAEALVLEVLRSGHLAQGRFVEELERLFADLAGTRYAIAVANGTLAIVAALQALELGPGDEVVTTPFTFVATINAALEAGATVRLADIRLDDFNLDADAAAALVGDATKVVLPVHLYGQAADCDAFEALARRHGLALVEDAAQAHGAAFDARPVGSFGVAGCFSLYATKNVTTGEGGVVTTSDPAVADRLRLLRNQGMRARYEYEIAGHNYRMTDLQAAVGLPQLRRIDEVRARRAANAAFLTEGLAGVEGLVTPVVRPGRTHVFHQYTVRVTPAARIGRDELAGELAKRGIGTGIYYPRVVHEYECYRNDPRVVATDVPNAERAAREVLSLPVHPSLSESDLERIVTEVRKLLA